MGSLNGRPAEPGLRWAFWAASFKEPVFEPNPIARLIGTLGSPIEAAQLERPDCVIPKSQSKSEAAIDVDVDGGLRGLAGLAGP